MARRLRTSVLWHNDRLVTTIDESSSLSRLLDHARRSELRGRIWIEDEACPALIESRFTIYNVGWKVRRQLDVRVEPTDEPETE